MPQLFRVAAITDEFSPDIEKSVASMAEIEDVTRQTTVASKQATGAAAELTQLAGRLAELVKRFKAD